MGDNICQRFCKTVDQRGSELAVAQPQNKFWQSITWDQYGEHVRLTAAALRDLGVRPGVRVAIWAPTSYAWAVHDLAIMSLGGITVPLYTNISAQDLIFQLNHSEAQILICETAQSCGQVLELKNQLSFVTSVISLEPVQGATEPFYKGAWMELMDQVAARNRDGSWDEFKQMCSHLAAKDIATLIYTSGTTGIPKGVLLGHEQIMSEVSEVFPLLGITAVDRTLTTLPYAHILGRIELWGQALIGYTVGYGSGNMRQDLKEIRPTLMVGVPRTFEKIQKTIMESTESSVIKKLALNWALKTGYELLESNQVRRPLPLSQAAQVAAARQLVHKRVKEALGGKLRFAVSGGAPLNKEVALFFSALGIPLLEGYGLTETTAAVTVNTLFHNQIGTVGRPIGEVQIREAEDGEILIKSQKNLLGYYLDPEETEAAFTEDGFLKTGDIGHLNSDGFLVITDRKKDLIKTSGGKFIAPQKLTTLFKQYPIVDYVHLHGDRRHYMVGLVTVNAEEARKHFPPETSAEYVLKNAHSHPEVQKEVRLAVTRVNEELAQHERIKYFKILPGTFSVDSGELTPSLKVRRQFCDTKYRTSIEELYS